LQLGGEGFNINLRWKAVLAMTRSMLVALMLSTLLGSSSSCYALCVYDSKLYAKTTLEQEFRDAGLVVRGEVLSNRDIDDPDTGALYQIRIDQSSKGKPPRVLIYYSERDSGGFYLDTGTQYLLFLNPISSIEAI